MSGRRERIPTGRNNTSSLPSARSETSNLSARSATGNQSARLSTARSNKSDLSAGEVLRRMREKTDMEKRAQQTKEIHAIGGYNAFSRPKESQVIPLRSVFLDPSVNNFPRSKTRTELLTRIRYSSAPHPSYDLDNDGYVSQEDYRLAKRFDFDGNGVLDADEREIGKRVLAEEFFKRHEHDLYNFGPNFVNKPFKQNVESLVNSYNFDRTYEQLMSVERTLEAEGSHRILSCICESNPEILKDNYFTNKFDTTAWNDYDAVPRSTSRLGLNDHGGSRRRLLFARTEKQKQEMESSVSDKTFKSSLFNSADVSHRRVNLITNPAVENS